MPWKLSALKHCCIVLHLCHRQFYKTKPLAYDPASLPKYPPCKEYDAKLRGQQAKHSGHRRQGLCIRQSGKRQLQGRRASSGPRHCAPTRRAPTTTTARWKTACRASALSRPTTLHTGGGFGPTWYNRSDQRVVPCASSSVRASTSHLTSQRSYAQSRGIDLHLRARRPPPTPTPGTTGWTSRSRPTPSATLALPPPQGPWHEGPPSDTDAEKALVAHIVTHATLTSLFAPAPSSSPRDRPRRRLSLPAVKAS